MVHYQFFLHYITLQNILT